jgi:hypothetical protein
MNTKVKNFINEIGNKYHLDKEVLTKKWEIKKNNFIKRVIIIQKYIRGYLVRKQLRAQKDKMSLEVIKKILINYNQTFILYQDINKILNIKKIRNQNFPSEISENLVKFAIFKKYKIYGNWDTKCGDLNVLNKKIEIKAFMSSGPTSFGPDEKWDWIYFVDAKRHMCNRFTIYELKLKNTSSTWLNLKVNKNETFKMQCQAKRRPRLCFSEIYRQLQNKFSIIFDGNIEELI